MRKACERTILQGFGGGSALAGGQIVVCPYWGKPIQWEHAWEVETLAHTLDWLSGEDPTTPHPRGRQTPGHGSGGDAAGELIDSRVDAAVLRVTRLLQSGKAVERPVLLPSGKPVQTLLVGTPKELHPLDQHGQNAHLGRAAARHHGLLR